MSTLGDMKARIASDLERTLTDVTSGARTWGDEIEDAILDAIQLNGAKPFWFLQEPKSADLTSSTTAGNSYVSEYAGLIRLDSLRITISGQKQQLYPIRQDEMEVRYDGSTSSGEPFEYARYGGRVRLYPTPGSVYTLTWSGIFEDDALAADTDSNNWTTHGELLIRGTAKLILLRDYIKSYDDVPAAQAAVMEAEKALMRESIMRGSPARLAKRC